MMSMQFTRKHKEKTFEQLKAAVFTGMATEDERKLYRQHKAREARESQAAWKAMKGWDQL